MLDLLTPDWLPRLAVANRLIVGFSGGLDSTVLLHWLAQQPNVQKKITVIHVNHGLSQHALAWEEHCQRICQAMGVSFIAERVLLDLRANVEEGARTARYAVFQSLLQVGDLLLLGHHLDDQAETVLLQLFRGAGVDGLSAMRPIKPFAAAQLARPLLSCSRQKLASYAAHHQLQWIEDDSNADSTYSRNFLRHEIMPLLRTRWPGVAGNLARTGRHCQQAQELLDDMARQDGLDISKATLSITQLISLTAPRIINVLRAWLRYHAIRLPDTATLNRLLTEVIFARQDANPLVSFGGYCVRRYQQTMYLLSQEDDSQIGTCAQAWSSFPEPLLLHNGLGLITPIPSHHGLVIEQAANLEIRYRQGGESLYWHGQSKSLKKLFQDWQIPTWLRTRIPLLYVDGELAAVIDYAISDHFYQSNVASYQFAKDV